MAVGGALDGSSVPESSETNFAELFFLLKKQCALIPKKAEKKFKQERISASDCGITRICWLPLRGRTPRSPSENSHT